MERSEIAEGGIMRKGVGFTLIELLVVIAIIALLLAILVPSLGKAKEHTRNILCRSNLKQYGLAMRMYLDDNDCRFPTTNIWLKSPAGGGYGAFLREGDEPDGVFWPYISSYDIHLCPSFWPAARGTSLDPTIRGNYVMNSYIGNNSKIWSDWLGAGVTGVTKESEVHRSTVLTFTEENAWSIPNYSYAPFNDTFFTIGNSTRLIDNFATFHNPPTRDRSNPDGGLNAGRGNLVNLDGSVDSVPRAKTPDDLDRGFRLAWPKKKVQ
ncbi:MAG: prepilin-type N-terminal cleavage/methylation domain-containing protein [Phycisphaerae bacterium]|nr:prepilin-type N-terminal cleavage/methylation domain-containing protein [Phycisphaerae bacterium]